MRIVRDRDQIMIVVADAAFQRSVDELLRTAWGSEIAHDYDDERSAKEVIVDIFRDVMFAYGAASIEQATGTRPRVTRIDTEHDALPAIVDVDEWARR
ncbi:MAG: hypothetical protein AAF531_10410 [Actinomycetota bacterium]